MAQKTIIRETAHTGLAKPRKATPSAGGIITEIVVIAVPRSGSQEYSEVDAAIKRGLADVAAGRVYTRRSYAEYADIEIED